MKLKVRGGTDKASYDNFMVIFNGVMP